MNSIPIGNIPIIGASQYQQKQLAKLSPEQQEQLQRQQSAADVVNARQRLYEQLFTAALCNPAIASTPQNAPSVADVVARAAMSKCEEHFYESRKEVADKFGLKINNDKE